MPSPPRSPLAVAVARPSRSVHCARASCVGLPSPSVPQSNLRLNAASSALSGFDRSSSLVRAQIMSIVYAKLQS